MATVPVKRSAPRNRLLLNDVDWRTYHRLLRIFAERPALRLTYDRGTLEIMSPLHEHDSDARFLGRLVIVLTEELSLPLKAGGSTTFRGRRRGLESDDCFWIANEPRVRGKRRIDLRRDPPPDVAIEVDVTSSSLNRMSIYAALCVPEVWRQDSQGLLFHILRADGTYEVRSYSFAFPFLAATDLPHFMSLRQTLDENAVVLEFREWIRTRLAGGTGLPGPQAP
jgi:Uma2 family endonuclease